MQDIIGTITDELINYPEKKFTWSEICYLNEWWQNDAKESQKQAWRQLVKEGRIEMVGNGWV